MKISFPQNLFQCPPKDNILSGKKICKQSKILFCGIARDVGKTLELNIKRINYLKKYFQESQVFIYENNSIDNTVDILKNSDICYISTEREDYRYRDKIDSGQDKNHFNRCKILADCRNQYIKYAEKNCSSYDFICIMDWDIRGWSYKGFFDSIYRMSLNEKIASVSAYGVLSDYHNNSTLETSYNNLLMYDSFAFRPANFYYPLYPQIQASFNNYKCISPTIVRSNFGGICIYKKDAILNNRYDAKEINGTVDADHVVINDSISNNGFYHLINNYFIASYSKHRFDNA